MLTARAAICLHYVGCAHGLAVINVFHCPLFLSNCPVCVCVCVSSFFVLLLFSFIFMDTIPLLLWLLNWGAHTYICSQTIIIRGLLITLLPDGVNINQLTLQIHKMFAGPCCLTCLKFPTCVLINSPLAILAAMGKILLSYRYIVKIMLPDLLLNPPPGQKIFIKCFTWRGVQFPDSNFDTRRANYKM